MPIHRKVIAEEEVSADEQTARSFKEDDDTNQDAAKTETSYAQMMDEQRNTLSKDFNFYDNTKFGKSPTLRDSSDEDSDHEVPPSETIPKPEGGRLFPYEMVR